MDRRMCDKRESVRIKGKVFKTVMRETDYVCFKFKHVQRHCEYSSSRMLSRLANGLKGN